MGILSSARYACLLFLCLCAAAWSLAAAAAPFAFQPAASGYFDGVVDPSGILLPGHVSAVVQARLDSWAPVLRETRNRLRTEVLLYGHGWVGMEDGMLAGLLACGIQPECGSEVNGRRLIIAAQAARQADANALHAVPSRRGRCYASPRRLTRRSRRHSGLTLLRGKPRAPCKLDLHGLQDDFPTLAGVQITASLARGGTVNAHSPLKRVMSGKRVIAWYGAVGQGRVLCLNATPSPGVGAHAALLRALLQRAGVAEAFRFTDASGHAVDGIVGFQVESADGTQSYVVAAAQQQVHARLYLSNRRLTGVRELDTAKSMTLHTDARGRYVEVTLAQGDGTLLVLREGAPGGTLQVQPAQYSLGEETALAVQVKRVDAVGCRVPLTHAFRVSLRGADGAVLPGATVSAAGPSPQVLMLPITPAVVPGRWQLMAEDLTDGTRVGSTIDKRLPGTPAPGLRLSWELPREVMRGCPLHGTLTLTSPGADVALPRFPLVYCDEPGVGIEVAGRTQQNPASWRCRSPSSCRPSPPPSQFCWASMPTPICSVAPSSPCPQPTA